MLSDIRIFFATDVHGSDVCFRKFVNAARVYGADVLILGGDITGKQLAPIVREASGWRASEGGVRHMLESQAELNEFTRRVSDLGAYPVHVDAGDEHRLLEDAEYRDARFRSAMLERVAAWAELAAERLAPAGVQCLVGLGNDDEPTVADVLRRAEWVCFPEGEVYALDEHEVVSWGWSNRTPWASPREQDEPALEAAIVGQAEKVTTPEKAIFNLHCPPWRSGLDAAPQVDETLKPVRRSGEVVMIPVGSSAVRHAIERFQPLVGLHGHVHESRGARKIGRTMCINPGSEYQHGLLRGALLHLTGRKLKAWALTCG